MPVGEIESITVVKTEFGEVLGLPESAEVVTYIVSRITVEAAQAQGRSTDDLLTTSGAVREPGPDHRLPRVRAALMPSAPTERAVNPDMIDFGICQSLSACI